jgi:Spy/CpxP family protein refolding chaperone
MRNSILKFALAASLILNISILATAGYMYYKQSDYWVSPFGAKMKKDRFLFEELSLRPEQLKTMKERAVDFRKEIDRRRKEIAEKRLAMLNLMRADSPDKKAIDIIVSDISGKQVEMQRVVAMHILEEKATLDKDQQKKFFDLIENAMAKEGG